jgi:hypothetical protein
LRACQLCSDPNGPQWIDWSLFIRNFILELCTFYRWQVRTFSLSLRVHTYTYIYIIIYLYIYTYVYTLTLSWPIKK